MKALAEIHVTIVALWPTNGASLLEVKGRRAKRPFYRLFASVAQM